MTYLGWRNSIDTIHNGWVLCKTGPLSGEAVSLAPGHPEWHSGKSQTKKPDMDIAHIAIATINTTSTKVVCLKEYAR